MPPLLLAVITSDMAYVREVAQHLYSGCLADVVALDGGAASEHSVWLPGALELPSSVHYVRVPQRPPWWLLQQFLVPPSQDPWLHQLPPPLLRQPPQSMTDVGWRWSVDRYAHIAVWDDVDRPRSWRAWNRTAYLQNVTTDRQADITGLSASTAEWASCVWPQLRLADAVQETAAPTGAAKAHLRRLFRACCDATTTTINSSEPTRPLPDPDGARPPPVADRWSRAIGNSLVLIDWSTPAAATTAAAGGLETEMRELRHALHTEAAASATATNASAGPWLVSVAAGLDGSKAMAPSQAMYAAVNEADPRTVIIVTPELDFITAVRRYLTPAAVCGDGRPPRDVLLLALRGGLPRDADGALQAVDMLRAAMPFDVVGITLRDESTDTESLGERSGAANRERNESVHVEPIQLPTDAAAGLPRGPRRSGGGGSELHSVVIEVFGPASAFRQSTWPCVWKAMSRPDSALLTVCGTGKRIGVWRGVQLPAEGDGDAGDGSSLTASLQCSRGSECESFCRGAPYLLKGQLMHCAPGVALHLARDRCSAATPVATHSAGAPRPQQHARCARHAATRPATPGTRNAPTAAPSWRWRPRAPDRQTAAPTVLPGARQRERRGQCRRGVQRTRSTGTRCASERVGGVRQSRPTERARPPARCATGRRPPTCPPHPITNLSSLETSLQQPTAPLSRDAPRATESHLLDGVLPPTASNAPQPLVRHDDPVLASVRAAAATARRISLRRRPRAPDRRWGWCAHPVGGSGRPNVPAAVSGGATGWPGGAGVGVGARGGRRVGGRLGGSLVAAALAACVGHRVATLGLSHGDGSAQGDGWSLSGGRVGAVGARGERGGDFLEPRLRPGGVASRRGYAETVAAGFASYGGVIQGRIVGGTVGSDRSGGGGGGANRLPARHAAVSRFYGTLDGHAAAAATATRAQPRGACRRGAAGADDVDDGAGRAAATDSDRPLVRPARRRRGVRMPGRFGNVRQRGGDATRLAAGTGARA
eukprot:ctg_212.g143